MRLARAIGADEADALAEMDLVLERRRTSPSMASRVRPRRSAPSRRRHAYDDLLVAHGCGRRSRGHEPMPARLRRRRTLGQHLGDLGPLLHRLVELEQAPLLALPLLELVAKPLLPPLARLRIGAVRATVQPVPLASRVKIALVAGLSRSRSWLMRRIVFFAAGDRGSSSRLAGIEEVVRLVEEQHRASPRTRPRARAACAHRRTGRLTGADLVEPGPDVAGRPCPTGPRARSRRARTSRRSPPPAGPRRRRDRRLARGRAQRQHPLPGGPTRGRPPRAGASMLAPVSPWPTPTSWDI